MSAKLFLLVGCLIVVAGQRGCPMEGCDSRGLYCQADFQISGSQSAVLWTKSAGQLNQYNSSTGCIANSANIICKCSSTEDPTVDSYISLSSDGKVRWIDKLMRNPQLPILDISGNIIATDGYYMEMRLANGTVVGHPNHYYGSLAPMSSILWVEEGTTFFFVSYQLGLLLFYDTSGMCVASYYLDEKDPVTNQTTSTWIPASKVVINSQMDPVTAYFLATNNKTSQHRLYALSINQEPPYLRNKWSVNITSEGLGPANMSRTPILCIGSKVFVGLGGTNPETAIFTDMGTAGLQTRRLQQVHTSSFSAFDMPASAKPRLEPNESGKPKDSLPVVWMTSIDGKGNAYILGWDSVGSGQVKYNFSVNALLEMESINFTSKLMTFGYHPDDITLVVAFSGHVKNYQSRWNQLISLRPSDITLAVLWRSPLDEIVGQITGLDDNKLIVTTSHSRIIALEIHD